MYTASLEKPPVLFEAPIKVNEHLLLTIFHLTAINPKKMEHVKRGKCLRNTALKVCEKVN